MWWIGSVLKYCKVPKYYDQDSSFGNLGEWFFVKILFRQTDALVKVHDEICGEVLSYDNDHGIENKMS